MSLQPYAHTTYNCQVSTRAKLLHTIINLKVFEIDQYIICRSRQIRQLRLFQNFYKLLKEFVTYL